jgi:uncharacterized protein with ACT and thioredoxin-like domain
MDSKTKCLVLAEKSGMTVSPLKEWDAFVKIRMRDKPGSLADSARVIAKKGINIVMSQSRTLEDGKLSEWDVLVKGKGKNLKKLESVISKLKNIEHVSIEY